MAMLPHGASRDKMKELLGWAPRPTHPAPVVARAGLGQNRFSFQALKRYNPTEIFVAVNGVRMTENHDYEMDMAAGTITFNPYNCHLDGGEEIEIRSTGPDVDPLQEVLLLPRKSGAIEFSDADLQDMAENSIGAIFEVDKIAKYEQNTEKLIPFAGKRLQVLSFQVTDAGLIGTGQRVIT